MTRIALLHNPLVRELRDLAASTLSRLPAIEPRMVDQLTELDLHYPYSPLSATPHGASAIFGWLQRLMPAQRHGSRGQFTMR